MRSDEAAQMAADQQHAGVDGPRNHAVRPEESIEGTEQQEQGVEVEMTDVPKSVEVPEGHEIVEGTGGQPRLLPSEVAQIDRKSVV